MQEIELKSLQKTNTELNYMAWFHVNRIMTLVKCAGQLAYVCIVIDSTVLAYGIDTDNQILNDESKFLFINL